MIAPCSGPKRISFLQTLSRKFGKSDGNPICNFFDRGIDALTYQWTQSLGLSECVG
jgi:hypothetical protein